MDAIDPKILALAKFLDINPEEEELEPSRYDDCLFNVGSREYLVLTDDEADQRTADYIAESVWAFRPEFLSAHSGIDESVFKMLQEKCEGANEPIKRMIKDWDHFVQDAIKADGRGHILNTYDGEEHEVKIGRKFFFIYRVN